MNQLKKNIFRHLIMILNLLMPFKEKEKESI